MPDFSLILFKQNKAFDISSLTKSIKWKGRKGSASRSLSITLINTSPPNTPTDPALSDITPENGDQLIFSLSGTELFRGIIMSQQFSDSPEMPIIAYDNGIYLSNNKDTFVYNNKTLHDIFTDVCKRFGINYSSAVSTSYRIPELTKSKTTAWDVIQDAASQDFKATGTRYFVNSSKGALNLIKRVDTVNPWVLETGNNIISYNYKKSIEDIKTRLKIYSDEDTVFAVKKNEALEKKIGIFQGIEKKDEKLSDAKLNQHITETLKELSSPKISMSVNAFGIAEVISGTCVYVIADRAGIRRLFYVDEDTHTFKGREHTMSLTLNSVN